MMEGITAPTQGQILYRGRPLDSQFLQEAGIQFQDTSLQEFLTVGDTLKLFSSLYQKTYDLDKLVSLCSLGDLMKRDTRRLSGGQRQRLLLAIALINDPEILFLDEPTTGLDPQSRRNFWALVEDIKSKGKTILLTTHYMDEAQALCDEIAIVDHGKIIAQGAPEFLLQRHFNNKVIRLPKSDVAKDSLIDALSLRASGGWVELHTANMDQAMTRLISEGVSVANMEIRSPNLEDLFIELTGRHLRS